MDLSVRRGMVPLPGRRGWAGRLGVAVALALACTGLAAAVAPAPASAAGPAWSVVATPNRPGPVNGSLAGVSCVSASACFGVGSSSAVAPGFYPRTLAESWNGSTWSVVPSPNLPSQGTIASSLNSISCTSARACTAVGSYDPRGVSAQTLTLIESWNGSTWSVVSSPNPAGVLTAGLDGVSCTSATACTAVGSSNYNDGGPMQTLIESWNGSKWSVVSSPDPSATVQGLNGVSCASATACTAAGTYVAGSGLVQTLIESWNGSKWSVASSPNEGLDNSYLTGVSCVSATSCTAVGNYDSSSGPALIESWNGKTWSVVSNPGHSPLSGVSCSSASFCAAVGPGLAESWNGSAWSVVPTPKAGLQAVSCGSASACSAVGDYTNTTTTFTQTLAESWHAGKWSVVPSGNHITYQNQLNGVSCRSASSCVAVGFGQNSNRVEQTLIESWNGSRWSMVPSPNAGTEDNVLNGVSCVSATFCVAVGDQDALANTLIETWNGSKWSITPSPNGSGADADQLLGVSCTSASSCTAVGQYGTAAGGSDVFTLAESWNGKSWSVVSSPNGPYQTSLTGVSCVSAKSCTAVGWYNTGTGADATLAESFNGSTWSVVSSPDQGTGNNQLSGISCRSASSCSAVGFYVVDSSTDAALAESWNGKTWSIVSSPNPNPQPLPVYYALAGVSCPSASSCTAVGSYSAGSYVKGTLVQQTLIESWNGSKWSVVSSPNPAGVPQLLAVSCATTTSCAAAGDTTTSGGSSLNLAERFG
jgi:hypothetical protein